MPVGQVYVCDLKLRECDRRRANRERACAGFYPESSKLRRSFFNDGKGALDNARAGCRVEIRGAGQDPVNRAAAHGRDRVNTVLSGGGLVFNQNPVTDRQRNTVNGNRGFGAGVGKRCAYPG